MVVPRSGRALAAASLVGIAAGTWLISPRFSIGGPSLIDDWAAVHFSPTQVRTVGGLLSTAGGRFRPSWIGWNYLQWHTLGAPGGMLGPNAWDVLRLAVFVVGVAVFACVLFRFLGDESRAGSNIVLAVVAPLLVVSTPQVAVDFARFGPQEPLLVGGMTLGGSLLYLGARELRVTAEGRRAGRITAFLVPGYAFWLIGVYQKEISVSVLVLVPFLYLARRAQVNRAVRALSPRRRLFLAGIGAAVLAPVLHVAVEVALIAHRGHLAYNGHRVNPGTREIRKTIKFFVTMPTATGSIVGLLLTVAIAIHVTVTLVRRKPDWPTTGLLTAALVCLAWSAQTEVYPSRYYIPPLTLVTVALCLALTQAGQRARLPALAAVCVLFFGSSFVAHRDVQKWATDDERGHSLVEGVARARSSGCSVVETGLDPERSASLPILSSLALTVRAHAPCAHRAFVVVGPNAKPSLLAACPSRERTPVGSWVLQGERLRLIRCSHLTSRAARTFADRRLR